eukprot:1568-Pelagomonas_calceolata.AAC.2
MPPPPSPMHPLSLHTGDRVRAEEAAAPGEEEAVPLQAAPDTPPESRRDAGNSSGEWCKAERLWPWGRKHATAERSGASGGACLLSQWPLFQASLP